MKHTVRKLGSLLCAVCMAVSGAAYALPAAAVEEFDPALAAFGVHTEGSCGEHVTWSLDGETGTLTISGTGDMKMTDRELLLGLMPLADSVRSVVVEEGVTGICDAAFISYGNLTSVSLPESLKSIGRNAFFGCTQLTELTVPAGVEAVGEGALLPV